MHPEAAYDYLTLTNPGLVYQQQTMKTPQPGSILNFYWKQPGYTGCH